MRGLLHGTPESLVITLLSITSVRAVVKVWQPDVEWNTARNWVDGHVPEDFNRIVFPEEMRHAVGLPRSAEIRVSGMDLAREGILVLPRDGSLELVRDTGKEKTKISKWAKEGPYLWADPNNWNVSSEAVPHFERIPCQQDIVVLPQRNHTVSIVLPITDMQVQGVRLADEKTPMLPWTWEHLRDQLEFSRGRFSVRYSNMVCSTCPCQNGVQPYYVEEVCAIQRPRCSDLLCENPLQVEGHCCDFCGGRVSLSKEASFSLVKELVDRELMNSKDTVNWHVRRTWDGATEILVTEVGSYSGVSSAEIVDRLNLLLKDDGIQALSMESSGAALRNSKWAMILMPFFGTLLVILMLLAVAFYHFGYSYFEIRKSCGEFLTSVRGCGKDPMTPRKPYIFARFENVQEGNIEFDNHGQDGDVDVDVDDEEEDDGLPSRSRRFENPLYTSKKGPSSSGRVQDISAMDLNNPVSLTALKSKVSDDYVEEIEMSIEQ